MLGVLILWYPIVGDPWVPWGYVLLLGAWGIMNGVVYLLLSTASGDKAHRILGVVQVLLGLCLLAILLTPVQDGSGWAVRFAAVLVCASGGIVLTRLAFRRRAAVSRQS